MAKEPVYPLYYSDFFTATDLWDEAEKWMYLKFLIHQWDKGHLPNNEKQLANLARCTIEEFRERWEIVKTKFKQDENGSWYNINGDKIKREREEYREKKSRAGKKGMSSRYNKPITKG